MTLVSKTLQGKLKVSRIGLEVTLVSKTLQGKLKVSRIGLDSDTGFQDTAGQVKGF